MAGHKETPRQKMIGMMYLVLTALLALNVQKEVLNAFVELDNGIQESMESGVNKLDALYADFKFAKNLDPEKTDKYWNDADAIRKMSEEMALEIDSIRNLIISKTEGIEPSVADTISLSNIQLLEAYDESTRILIGQKADGEGGAANELKLKLIDLELRINEILDKHQAAGINLPIDFSERDVEGENLTWEVGTFYDTPLAGSVAILSKIVNDVRNMEFAAVSRLFEKIDGEDIPIDTVLAKVIPKSNYVLLGENYESDVFLGAYSTTTDPIIRIGELNEDKTGFIGEYTELDVENGTGKLVFDTGSEGLFEYAGIVTIFDKQGNEKNYPFESSYLVARPSAVVSPTAMNVLYKGLDNPVSVSVPGIPDEDIVVNITGSSNISKISGNNYSIKLSNNAPSTVHVNVSAKKEDGSLSPMGSMEFRTKFLPKPYARIQDISSVGKMRKNEFKALQGIIPTYGDDFLFDLPLEVVSFKVNIKNVNGISNDRTNNGKRFKPELVERFKNIKVADDVLFHSIMIKGKDGKIHEVNDILITIIN